MSKCHIVGNHMSRLNYFYNSTHNDVIVMCMENKVQDPLIFKSQW